MRPEGLGSYRCLLTLLLLFNERTNPSLFPELFNMLAHSRLEDTSSRVGNGIGMVGSVRIPTDEIVGTFSSQDAMIENTRAGVVQW